MDEVIQERLLAKREEVRHDLEAEYARQGDILKNQLSFRDAGMTFPQFRNADDFVRDYPFAPYQFKLLQKIFESIRKAGATGLHLAQGERSLLDAFQHAGQSVARMEVGILVPLYRFYPSIESFLDTTVKRTIDQAKDNASLEDFDTRVLEVLFLIRYVDEIKGNVDNLVTLCLDQIDADRLALRKTIEASLQRLERETLVNRSGDTYFFLTSEERDINREIKNVELGSAEEAKLVGELVFDDVLKGHRKHRFSANKMDFSFNRICDAHPVGNRTEGALIVSIMTPLADDYESYQDGRCVLESSREDGQVLIRLRDDESLGRELRTLLRTEKYIRTKDDGTLPPTTKRIHRDLADENRIRRDDLIRLLGEMLADASYFVAGQRLEVSASAPQIALSEAMEYLIQNTFNKMSYLKTLCTDPLKEIQAVLRSNDIGQYNLGMDMPESNPQATEDLRDSHRALQEDQPADCAWHDHRALRQASLWLARVRGHSSSSPAHHGRRCAMRLGRCGNPEGQAIRSAHVKAQVAKHHDRPTGYDPARGREASQGTRPGSVLGDGPGERRRPVRVPEGPPRRLA